MSITYVGTDADKIDLCIGSDKTNERTKHWQQGVAGYRKLVTNMSKPRHVKKCGGYAMVKLHETESMCVVDGGDPDNLEPGQVADKNGDVRGPCVGIHKTQEAIDFCSLLTLDIDKALPDFPERLLECGYAGLYHTTFSHDPDSGIHKYRALVRLTRAVTGVEKRTITFWLMEQLGLDQFDKSCAAPEHFMYWPSVHPDREQVYVFEEMDGELLDVDAVLMIAPEVDAAPERLEVDTGAPAPAYALAEAQRLLDEAVRDVSAQPEGNRNQALFSKMEKMWGLVLGGALDENEMLEAMRGAAEACDMPDWEFENCSINGQNNAVPYQPSPEALRDDRGGFYSEGFEPVDGCGWIEVDDSTTPYTWSECKNEPDGDLCVLHQEKRRATLNNTVFNKVLEESLDILGDENAAEDAAEAAAEALTGRVTRWLGGNRGRVRRWYVDEDAVDYLADALLRVRWTAPGPEADESTKILCTWLDETREWHGKHYEPVPPGHMHAEVNRLLEKGNVARRDRHGAIMENESGEKLYTRIKVTPGMVKSVVEMIEYKTLLHASLKSGHWLDTTNGRCPVGPAERRYIAFNNGLLDLETMQTRPHEAAFFNTHSLRFDYDPEAVCPEWEQALENWFPGDKESKDGIEEMMGYLLLGGMEKQKIFVLLGKPRAGKGTVMRLVHHMLGSAFAAQSLDSLIDRFGKEPLIGKRVVHFTEATVAPGPEGRKIVSLLKSVSGEDTGSSIQRKGTTNVSVDLECRFVLTGNEDVTLPDPGGVMVTRLIGFDFQQSFLGKEDETLTDSLIDELPGIFNRIKIAYDRMMDRGRFVQPVAGGDLLKRLGERSNPGPVWFTDTFELTESEDDIVLLEHAVDRYRDHFSLKVGVVSDLKVMNAIKALLPTGVQVKRDRLPTGDKDADGKDSKVRYYTGLRWKVEPASGEPLDDDQRVDWMTGEVAPFAAIVDLEAKRGVKK